MSDERKWTDWGEGVEILTRRMCGGCQELKRRLRDAGIMFRELDIDTVDGQAAAAWYDSPALLSAVAVNGRLLEGAGDVDKLLADLCKEIREELNS